MSVLMWSLNRGKSDIFGMYDIELKGASNSIIGKIHVFLVFYSL